MNKKVLFILRERLIKRRQEIFGQVVHLELNNNSLEEQPVDHGEKALKEDGFHLRNRLDQRRREKIEAIDIALERMDRGTYGICILCDKQISIKRLKILPEACLCRKCARTYEKIKVIRQHPGDETLITELLDDYRDLEDDDMLMKISKLICE